MRRGAFLCLVGLCAPVLAQGAAPLKLWHCYRGAEEAAIEKAVQAFERQTGLDVELLGLPNDSFASKVTSAIPHGAGPDVFIFAHERLRQFATNGLVASTDGRLDRAAYFTNAVEVITVDGRPYGYPLAMKNVALYTNRALVPSPPRTTDEWETLFRQLSKPDENRFGLAYEAGDFYYHAAFLFGFGGELFSPAGRAQFDTEAMHRSLAYVRRLQDERWMPQELSGALTKALFNEGRAAVVIGGPWFAGEVAPGITYDVSTLPTVSATGLPLRPFLGVETAMVSARSTQPEQAHQLAGFLSLGEAALVRALEGRQVPANVAAYDDARVAGDAFISSFRQAAMNATPMPTTLEMARVWEPMKLALKAVLQGGVEPRHAGALADRRYRALNRDAPPIVSATPYLVALGLGCLGYVLWKVRRRDRTVPFARRFPDLRQALVYVGPAAAGITVLVLVPFAVGISLALFHHQAGSYSFVGLANFRDILASRGYSLTEPLSFYFTLAVTLLWTLVNVALHVGLGLALAMLLKSPLLRLRGVFRVLLIVPWAVPNYITAGIWKGMFHRQFGAINGLLAALGLEPVSWFTHFSTSFAANVATNTWLGFPFMMVVALGALQSIPQDLYEAAEVDGASRWTQFRRITLPLLKPAMLPAITMGSVWTFNMFNVIYLVSGGDPGGATDILISDAYRWAFQRNEQYGFAAAYSVLIFFVLLAWTRVTRKDPSPRAAE